MNNFKEYVVYALVLNKECVYVGCTSIIKNRVYNHRASKLFDSHIIISRHIDKKEALLAERSIIKFLSIFGGDKLYNGKYDLLSYEAKVELELQTDKNNY
jgi:hypothetical protein